MAKKKKNKTANEVKKEKEAVISENISDTDEKLQEEAKIAEALLKNEDSAVEKKSDEPEVEVKKTKTKAKKTRAEEDKVEEDKAEEAKAEETKAEETKADSKESEKAKADESKSEKSKNDESLVKSSSKELSKKAKPDDEVVPDKKKYAEIMKTSSFVKAFVLMLIPGINIICVLLWAVGAAKNKNKVHFTRACIILFIIEIFLTVIVLGAGYIAASVKEAEILDWMDTETNGLISYFEIDSYKELPKLLETSKHLESPEEEDTTEPEEPKTCYVYNPDGIDSYDTFMKLWNAKFHKETVTESATQAKDLFTILEENNVDTEESKMIYIIIDNDNESCVIAFDPTGELQSFPEVKINNENVFIGGTK